MSRRASLGATVVFIVSAFTDVNSVHLASLRLSASNRAFWRSVTIRPGRLNRLIERYPRDPVITGKSDQRRPKLDGIREIIRTPHSHLDSVEQNRNII